MIASLLRQRALLVVRQVTGCNGLEAYRTLILHAYSEYEKLGSRLNDDLKTAILMRGVTGQLKSLASTAGQRGHNLQQGQRDDFAL